MPKSDLFNYDQMPLGMSMAFAENMDAMRHFTSLPRPEQQTFIENAHNIKSRDEMHAYVKSLVP